MKQSNRWRLFLLIELEHPSIIFMHIYLLIRKEFSAIIEKILGKYTLMQKSLYER